MQMDFLGVSDAGDWGDWSDTRDLHAQLFSHKKEPGKKLKRTKKKQTSVAKKQDPLQARVETSQRTSSQKQDSVGKLNDDTSDENRKKLKRKRGSSKSRSPTKKQKACSVSDAQDGERILEVAAPVVGDDSKISEEEGNVDQSLTKKKRKRKPRNNKFKTPEFGYVPQPQPSETNQSRSGSAKPENSKSVARETKKNRAKNTSKRARETDAKSPAAKEESASLRTEVKKNRKKKRTKSKAGSEHDSSHSPQQKMPRNLEGKDGVKEVTSKSNKRTKVKNSKAKNTDVKCLGETPMPKGELSVAENVNEDKDGPASSLKGGKDAECESEEPQPDQTAKQALKSQMEARLEAAHFRFLNEQLYKTTGSEAHQMIAENKESFDVYHQGFTRQVKQWPVNPVDQIIEDLKSRPASLAVGDFGCGEARIAQSVRQKVHSFDLCALNEHVQVCNMERVPLKKESLDVAIFCLSLMGTNWIAYVKEANRVLKTGGQLKIAEVASRFTSVANFLKIMKQLGFKQESKDFSNKMFLKLDFTKVASAKNVDLERGEVLRPCLYKRR